MDTTTMQRQVGLRQLLRGKRAQNKLDEVERKVRANFNVSGKPKKRSATLQIIKTFDAWLTEDEAQKILDRVHPKK